ncbi:MAG TPA: hypothetical protein ENK84_06190 [Desulfobulbus sp.]|nr:hypothetical protein [Desulfobulbus sp.]
MDRTAPKLLIIADQGLTSRLSDYALKVAIRLDLEIIVLFLLDKVVEDSELPPLLDQVDRYRDAGENNTIHNDTVHYFSDGHSDIILADTKKRFEQEAADFAVKAWKAGIKVITVVDVEGKERAIAKIRRREPEIRFLLSNITEDKQDDDSPGGHPRLRVFRH